VNVLEIAAGVVFIAWPLWYRRQLTRFRRRAAERGEDIERFDQTMGRPVMRVLPWVAPVVGALLIVAGVTGG
jgi:hypothetical protein